MSRALRLVAVPLEPHPYQESLYGEMRELGVRVRYAGALTPSRTLNLLLLPFELVVDRLRGARVLHVHWVFIFQFPGSRRFPILRRLAQSWFGLVLALAHRLRLRVVWTAHNVLPHDRVFHDDVAARRRLVAASDVVIAHSPIALPGLRERVGAVPRRSVFIPLGPSAPFADVEADELRSPGSGPGPRRCLFMGKISEYKGVEDLLEAAARRAGGDPLEVLVTGACPDGRLRGRLRRRGEELADRVQLRLEHVPDAELTELIGEADAVVLPFRRLTTSSSVIDAMWHGRPVVIPAFPAFSGIPDDAVIRYDGTLDGLAAALDYVAGCDGTELRRLGSAARSHAASFTWPDAARQTIDALSEAS